MRLTTFTDYSIRVLVYLAVKAEDHSTVREIAERYKISRNHLMKVVQELSQRGYISSRRGKNGGLLLSKRPADIRIGTLVRQMESDLALVECLGKNNQCILQPSCALQGVLSEALAAFFDVLDAYTLEDVLHGRKRAELTSILDLDVD